MSFYRKYQECDNFLVSVNLDSPSSTYEIHMGIVGGASLFILLLLLLLLLVLVLLYFVHSHLYGPFK